jgi:hypothetical protein
VFLIKKRQHFNHIEAKPAFNTKLSFLNIIGPLEPPAAACSLRFQQALVRLLEIKTC